VPGCPLPLAVVATWGHRASACLDCIGFIVPMLSTRRSLRCGTRRLFAKHLGPRCKAGVGWVAGTLTGIYLFCGLSLTLVSLSRPNAFYGAVQQHSYRCFACDVVAKPTLNCPRNHPLMILSLLGSYSRMYLNSDAHDGRFLAPRSLSPSCKSLVPVSLDLGLLQACSV
jgi:hypothetical protein